MPSDPILRFPPFEIDLAGERLMRGTETIRLRPKTFAVLRYLAEHPGRMVSRQELLSAVWPDVHVGDGLPKDSVLEIRRALGDDPRTPRFIETVHARGYRFVATVHRDGGAGQPAEPPPGIVGRDAELERLAISLDRAAGGARQVVFVSGEAGIGKTTLLDAFRRRCAADVDRYAHGQCIEHFGNAEPYMPVLEALIRLARASDGARVRALLRERAPSWLAQMPALVDGSERQALAQATATTTRARMLRELGDALDALTADQTLVLALEDLHWSDHSTLELLSALARRPERARLMVIGTYRPLECLANGHPVRAVIQELRLHRHCEEMRLPMLAEEDVRRYVAWRFDGADQAWPGEVGRAIHRRTEGSPLFMVQVIDALVARGVLTRVDERWDLTTATLGSLEAPVDVRQMIERQLDHLAGEDQRALEAASIAGTEFSCAAVAAGLDQPLEAVEARCAALARREQFLAPGDSTEWPDGTIAARHRFVHTLHRDVVYERIPAARRAELHRRIGEREERAYGRDAREVAAELAVHFERGGDHERATRYHKQAAQNALAQHAYHEAADQLTRAIASLRMLPESDERDGEEIELQLGLAMPLLATRSEGAPEVEQALARAHHLSERLGDPFRLPLTLLGQWGLRFARAELRTARELATQLLSLARSARPRVVVLGAHLALGLTATYEGDLAAAQDHLQQVSSVYDPERARPYRALFDLAGLIEPRVTCAVYGAILSCMRGHLDRALTEIETGRRVANELANAYAQVTASAFAAMVHESRREPAAVAERAGEALAMARQHGFPQWAGLAMALRGWATAAQGQHDAGLAELREGIETWRGTGTEIGQTYLLGLLADAHGRAGDVERALEVLDEAIATMEQSGERLVEAELLRLRGEMLGARDPGSAEADRCLRDALAIARRRGVRLLELRVSTSLARRWMGRGQTAKARRLLSGICGSFTEGAGTGDLEAARALLEDDDS